MKLSKIALLALKGLGRAGRKTLADKMGLTEDTLYRWMRTNDDNLTKAAHLSVIQETLGLEQDQILEHSEEMDKV